MWHFMHTHACSQHKRAIHVSEKIHLVEIICMGKESSEITSQITFFCNTVSEEENSQMPSTEVEELHLQPQLFGLQCPSVHLLNEPNTYEKNLKLVLLIMKWFLCVNILHHVLSVRHIITSHLQPINSAWTAFLRCFFSFLSLHLIFVLVGEKI